VRSRRLSYRFAVALALGCAQCVNVTDARTRREATIGHRQSAALRVDVEDGLAAIRAIDSEGVTLWASAPVLRLHVQNATDLPAPFVLMAENVLPDAELDARLETGEALDVVGEAGAVVTHRRWRLELPGGARAELRIGPPDAESNAPFRFALLSDVQEAIDRVQDIYRRMNEDRRIRFVISSGDLTRRGARDELVRFQRELLELHVPFFSTTGNHELGTEDGAPFQDDFGRANFRFLYRGAQFTFIDSGSATLDPLVYDWLDGWLAEGSARVHTVTMHIPPLDPIGLRNGSFADRAEAAKVLTRLALGNVDLTLYGHVHSFYAFANAGIPAYISGGGGAIPERLDGIGRNYLTIDVDPLRGVRETGLVRIDPE
jgi:Icc protein